jgi:hypothetical protein
MILWAVVPAFILSVVYDLYHPSWKTHLVVLFFALSIVYFLFGTNVF